MTKKIVLPLTISVIAILLSAIFIILSIRSNIKTKYYLNASEKSTAAIQKNIELKAIASEIYDNRKSQYEKATTQLEYLKGFEAYKTQPTVFFTFDDGPNEYALQMAEYLYSEGISGTFFSVCSYVETDENAEILRKIVNMGFSVGIHGYYHDTNIYNGYEAFMQDLQSAQSILKNKGIQQSKLLRFPWASASAKEALYKNTGNDKAYNKITAILIDVGYSIVDFDISGNDWVSEATTDSIIADTLKGCNRILSKTYKAGVVLLHCTKTSADALPEIVRELKGNGFSFDILKEENYPYYLFSLNN